MRRQIDDSANAEVDAAGRPLGLEAHSPAQTLVSTAPATFTRYAKCLAPCARDAGDFFADDIQLYLRDVYDHSVHVIESLEDLRDLATGLLDVYLSTVAAASISKYAR